jgi:hypothetical protein
LFAYEFIHSIALAAFLSSTAKLSELAKLTIYTNEIILFFYCYKLIIVVLLQLFGQALY